MLLALGVLAAPLAEAQTVDYVPAVTGATPGSGDEGTTIVFRMRLLDGNASNQPVGAPAGGLTVNLTVSDATTAGADFLAPATEGAKTVTFAEGASSATLSIPTVDDNQDEPNGEINVTIVAGTGYTTPTDVHDAGASIQDNDAVAGVRLWVEDAWHTRGTSSSHLNIAESGGTQALTATVTMLGEDGKPVSRSSDTEVALAFGGVELEEDDFISGEEATVTIPAGRSWAEKVLHITPNHDTEQEDPERFDLTAGIIIVGVGSYEDRVPMYLVDDGWEEPIATIAAGTSPVTEGTDATFTVTLSRAVSTAISVGYGIWWSKEGAFWDPDNAYGYPTSVDIAANATTGTITVPTHEDAVDEPDGYVQVIIGNGRHYRAAPMRAPWFTPQDSAKVVVTDNDGAGAPPGEEPDGEGTAALTGLSVSSVSGEPTQLAVSWDAVQDAARYDVRWKTSSGDYGDAVEASTNRHTITDLSAGTTYTVNVAALDEDNTLLAEGAASGATEPRTGTSEAPAEFVIYHDADHSAAAVSRYDTAIGLLDAASRSYAVRTVTGTGEVDRLAGVSDSVMPRFFLGDPAAADWGPSEPGVNNGGLRWLRSALEEPAAPAPAPSVPSVSIAGGGAVDEGTAAAFTVTLSAAAPEGGLTLGYTASEDGEFVAGADEGAKTVGIAAGETSATLSVATADDGEDEADGTVTVTLDAGEGYEVGDPSSASVTVRDNDEAAAVEPEPAITVYHDPNHSADAVGRYDTAVGLLGGAGRSYTVRTVTGTAEVDRLAGVTNSVMPRFFLGDPAAEGWGPSQPGTNNGGLRWLRSLLVSAPASSAPAAKSTAVAAAEVSVADARVKEAPGAALAFAVTLDRAPASAVSVDYATADGTAAAGADYTAARGTLTFAAGETSKTVSVAVLDDAHDEGEETLKLTLSNPSGLAIADGEAAGTIENTDLMPAALLVRFGRAAAEQAVEHIEERMAAPRRRGFRARFAGRELRPGQERDFALGLLSRFAQPMGMGPAGGAPMGMGSYAAGAGAPGMGTAGMGCATGTAGMTGMAGAMGGGAPMTMGPGAAGALGAGAGGMGCAMGAAGIGGTAGMGGAMSMGGMGMSGGQTPMGGAAGPAGYGSAGGAHGGGLFGSMGMGGDLFSNSEFELNRESRGGMLSVWSRSSRSYFSGIEDALSLNGDTRTTMFGADWMRGPLTLGLSVGRTFGMGGYSGPSGGQMSTSMTGFYPWVGYQVNDRVSVWGVTGYGAGSLSLTPDGQSALDTGVSMRMSAVGTRGELVGARATGGFALAFKADALLVTAASDLLDGPTGRLNASDAGVTRVRTALEGSRGFTLGGGRLSLTPSVEVGLRRDGGDAETGAGMDVGGGLAFTDAVTGLSLDVRVRTLVVHQAEGFSERGMSLSFGWDPTPSSPLGLTARVAPSWGGSAQGGAEALWGSQMAYGMGSHQMHGSGGQVNAEVGYGLPVGMRFVGTPRVGLTSSAYGRDYRVGYTVGVLDSQGMQFELGVDASRRESPMHGGADSTVLGRAGFGW